MPIVWTGIFRCPSASMYHGRQNIPTGMRMISSVQIASKIAEAHKGL